MWIKVLPQDFKERISFDKDVVFLWKDDNRSIYISDNHLTAAWCWLQECEPNERYNFMHIDRHGDLKGCGHPHLIDFIKDNPKLSFKDYLDIKYSNGNMYQFFQWDNYIRACYHLFPEWFNTNYFYVHESIWANENGWGYKAFPFKRRNALYVREDLSQFLEEASPNMGDGPIGDMWNKPWIVNLDLDFFWDTNKVKIFDEQFIRDFARRINRSMASIKVLTIALSPDCVAGKSMPEKWNNVLDVLKIFQEELQLS